MHSNSSDAMNKSAQLLWAHVDPARFCAASVCITWQWAGPNLMGFFRPISLEESTKTINIITCSQAHHVSWTCRVTSAGVGVMWHPPPVSFSWPIFIGRSLRSVNPEISLVRSLGKTCLWTLPHAFLEPIHMQVPGVNLQANLLTNGRNQRLFLTSVRGCAQQNSRGKQKRRGEHVRLKGKDGHLRISVDPWCWGTLAHALGNSWASTWAA